MKSRAQDMMVPLLGRLILFAALWWVLSENGWNDFLLIGLSIIVAAVSSLYFWGRKMVRINLGGALKFIPYFLWQSLLGGMDVARRALMPGATLQPGFVEFTSRLQTSSEKVLFVWVVNLLPGSAGISIEGETIRIHALDTELVTMEQLQLLEAKVQGILAE